MANLQSDKIKIFPSARRINGEDPFSRLMSESTLTSIINQLLNVNGFVITQNDDTTEAIDTSKPLEFNLHGYYVKVEDVPSLLSNFTNDTQIYASIELSVNTNDLNNLNYVELVATDTGGDDSKFKGVNFTNTEPSGTNVYSLLILRKVNGNWEIPNETLFDVAYNNNSPVNSRVKFSPIDIAYYGIDGGVI